MDLPLPPLITDAGQHCIDRLANIISVCNKFDLCPRVPVSLYHQTLFKIIKSELWGEFSFKRSKLTTTLNDDLDKWKKTFPIRMFSNNLGLHLPVFLQFAQNIRLKNPPSFHQYVESHYPELRRSANSSYSMLKDVSKKNFIDNLATALEFVPSIPFLQHLSLVSIKMFISNILKTLKLACETKNYSLILYWVKVINLHITIPDKYLESTFRQFMRQFITTKIMNYYLICRVLAVGFKINIPLNQIILAAEMDDLDGLKKKMTLPPNYYDLPRIGMTACQVGSLSCIKHLMSTVPNNWKNNEKYACSAVESSSMPTIEFFLQRRYRIRPMLLRAINVGNLETFSFLFLVVAKAPHSMAYLKTELTNQLIATIKSNRSLPRLLLNNDSRLDYPTRAHYIILRYITFIKTTLRMTLTSEENAAAILQDTQLLEYIKFKRRSRNLTPLDKMIGFPIDETWSDQLDSINVVHRAAFQMLLQSTHYIRRGINRLLVNNGNKPLIDPQWALAAAIEHGNKELQNEISFNWTKFNFQVSQIQSKSKSKQPKRPLSENKNKKTSTEKPTKRSKLS